MEIDKSNKIAIIGSGALGTALACVLYDNGFDNIHIYGIDQNEVEQLKIGKNEKYFDNLKLPSFKSSLFLEEVIDKAKYIVLAIPSIAIDSFLKKLFLVLKNNVLLINGTKGFFPSSTISVHKGIEEATKNNNLIRGVVSILGPSYAKEIVLKQKSAICAINEDLSLCLEVKNLFDNQYFKLDPLTDVIGAENGSICKNVYAIGSGMLHALDYTINTISVYFTKALKEIKIFNQFMNGKEETLFSLSVLGDFILTCSSNQSRNFTFGYNFIKNKQKISDIKTTTEGLYNLKTIYEIVKKNNLKMPILISIYELVYLNADINTVIDKLWNSF